MELRQGCAGGLEAPVRQRVDHFSAVVVGQGQGRRLGAVGRGMIAAGLAHGVPVAQIASEPGMAPCTVYREIAPGRGPGVLRPPGQPPAGRPSPGPPQGPAPGSRPRAAPPGGGHAQGTALAPAGSGPSCGGPPRP